MLKYKAAASFARCGFVFPPFFFFDCPACSHFFLILIQYSVSVILPANIQHVMEPQENKKSSRGFASMDQARQREIAAKGGRVAHERGKAHKFTTEEAKRAGRKGGLTLSRDKAHMARIGRKGGRSGGGRREE